MSTNPVKQRILKLSFVAFSLGAWTSAVQAADLLVVDRLSDAVYRYGRDGTFKNVVVQDPAPEGSPDPDPSNDFISQPTGIALSPDRTKMYVSSSQNNR